MSITAKPVRFLSIALLVLSGCVCAAQAGTQPVTITFPGGEQGLGLDDMTYVPALHRIVVPAGQTGALMLINPANNALTSIPGVTPSATNVHGRDQGTSSAAYGAGLFFASDHTDQALVIVDPVRQRVLARVPLASDSDYVRYLATAHEVWVTEPDAAQIQVFRFTAQPKPTLTPETVISVPGGPEALVFDTALHRAYANLWKEKTVVMDTTAHRIVTEWENGCQGGRGLTLDATHQQLFVGCKEGAVSVLALTQDGKILAHAKAGAGIDIISYSPALQQLYVPGSKSATLTVFGTHADGSLQEIAVYPTAEHAHCVTDDDHGHVFVCNPRGGGVLEINTVTR